MDSKENTPSNHSNRIKNPDKQRNNSIYLFRET